MHPHSSPPARRRGLSFVPRVEALEDRRLLAVSVSLGSSGTLLVTGDAAANSIEIRDNGTGAAGNITVIGDGVMTTRPEVIRSIRITTRDGSDTVHWTLTGDLS